MALRTRLLLALGAVALVALLIADAVTYAELRSFLYDGVDQSLQASHVPVERSVSGQPGGVPGPHGATATAGEGGPPPGIGGGPLLRATCPTFDDSFVDTSGLAPGTFIEVRSADNTIVWSCRIAALGTGTNLEPTLPARITINTDTGTGTGTGPEGGSGGVGNAGGERSVYFTTASSHAGTQFRVRASVLSSGTYLGGELILAVPLGPTAGTLDRLFRIELAVTAGALLSALALGWWLVRVGMQPLRAMERAADAIAQGDLDQRVPGEQARTEVGHLARALNVMLSRIESAFSQRDETELELRESEARMRQFVADASHELRTPLAAVAAYAELFERGASGRPEDLGRVMEGIRTETSRMGGLVEDLTLLARLDEGRPLERHDVEMVGLVAQAVQTAAAVGPQWPVRLQAAHPVEVVGDRLRLRQVLDNLLANIRAHTPPGTPAIITVTQVGEDMVMTVADEGPGLSDEQAAHVFERFYRADPSRSRRRGGSGLGLAIVASIVRAHDGEVGAMSEPNQGTIFTIRIPAAGPHSWADDIG